MGLTSHEGRIDLLQIRFSANLSSWQMAFNCDFVVASDKSGSVDIYIFLRCEFKAASGSFCWIYLSVCASCVYACVLSVPVWACVRARVCARACFESPSMATPVSDGQRDASLPRSPRRPLPLVSINVWKEAARSPAEAGAGVTGHAPATGFMCQRKVLGTERKTMRCPAAKERP